MSKNLSFPIFVNYLKSEYDFVIIKNQENPNKIKLYNK